MITADQLAQAIYEVSRPTGTPWGSIADTARQHYRTLAEGLLDKFVVLDKASGPVTSTTDKVDVSGPPVGSPTLQMPVPQLEALQEASKQDEVAEAFTEAGTPPSEPAEAPGEAPAEAGSPEEASTSPETPRGKKKRRQDPQGS